MKQLFPLAWAGLKSRKRSTVLLLSAIMLSVAFLVVMGLIGSSSVYTIDLQNKDLYGGQKLVAWDLTEEQKKYFQNSSVWTEIGKIEIYGAVVALSDTPLGIGAMDETAICLGHIQLAEGRWPQMDGEIALEKNAYRHIGNQPYAVGDRITLEIMVIGQETPQLVTFQVVGLIENYSAVWRSAYAEQTKEGIVFPATASFLVAGPGAVDYKGEGDFKGEVGFKEVVNFKEPVETWLLNSPSNSYQVLHANLPEKANLSFNYSAYPQIGFYGGMSEAALFTGKLITLIGGMVLVCMMVILLNGFLMSVDRRKQQFSLLRCIGATKRQACSYLFCEAFLLLGMGIPSGLLLGVLVSFGAVKLFSALAGTEIIYHFNAWILIAAVAICVLCVCLATLLPALRASKAAPIADLNAVYVSRKSKILPQNEAVLKPFGLMLLSMQRSKGKAALTTVTFALVILVFHVMMMTDIVDYQMDGTYQRADASLEKLETSDRKEDGFWWRESDKADAIPVSVFSDVRSSVEIAFQNAVVIPGFYCSIPFSSYDSYLNGHFHFDYQMLGLKNWERWGQYHYSFEQQIHYGYAGQEYLIEPRITIFDDFLLEQFQTYVTDGDINITAIQQGEEIVLCMPDYYLLIREEENGIEMKEWIPDGKAEIPENAKRLTNGSWKAGDMLTLTWLRQEGDIHIRQERTVRIGAIVKGAPQIENSSSGVFCMAVGQNTLENLNVPYEISEVCIYFKENADIPAVEAYLGEIASSAYPLARLSTRTEEVLAEQQQRNTRLAVSGMIAACLLILGFLGLLNTVSSRIHSRLHEIGLLRCIGMTKGQVYRMFVYEGIVFGLLSSVLGTASSLWILPKYQGNWLDTRMPFYILLSCLACTALSVLTIFWPARAVLQKSPTDML